MLALALGCALVMLFLLMIYRSLSRPGPTPQAPVPPPPTEAPTRVLIAKGAITEGQELTVNDLAWATWPKNSVPDSAIQQSHQPDAQTKYAGYRARSSFSANEIIQVAKLVDKEGGGWVASILPEGQRLVTFPVGQYDGGGGWVQPKDKVDIMMIPDNKDTSGGVGVLMSDVYVFAINGYTDPAALAASKRTASGTTGPITITPESLTLQVSMEDSTRLLEISKSRKLHFQLRPLKEPPGEVMDFDDTRTIPLTIQRFDVIERSQ
ncbi:MAG: Flp pilus assembly protein CpaB [Methylobacteriaceae bacterium]|jgi:pilus assembly protein CpaB|nr:Flp pilus assembly protein CpaB [Methylobacteriaceae bacterium]